MTESKKKSMNDWVNLKTISVTANIVLFADILFLFLNYYGIIEIYFSFINNNFAILIGWIYLSLNIVAVNIFEYIRKNGIKKICPHCNEKLIISKYKCEKCDKEF